MAFFAGLLTFSLLFLLAGYLFNISYLLHFANDMRLAAATMFILIGVMHLLKPHKLTYMIEGLLPYAYALVILTGILEIIFGAGLLHTATQYYAAWALMVLLVLMFPANIYVAVKQLPAPGGLPASPWYTWSRLAFQPLYILWIWWSIRG
ncbi:DoxX family protein [Chitinophaga defluvii]|uniref:DoxX-like protein n=1 Tax=Chitinophaga defluvii TaxID=3163343 RepID=A0ABV2T5Q5_9BACT